MIVICKHLSVKETLNFPEALSIKDGKTVVVYGVLSSFRLKNTIDWVNEATNIDFSQFWIWCWARVYFLASQQLPSHCVLMWQREGGRDGLSLLCRLLLRLLVPFMRTPPS